jgi:hypothetical protein
VDVIPVVGLLAETTMGARYKESDTHLLHLLAGTDRKTRHGALYSADDFEKWGDAPIGIEERRRLLTLLGLYGLKEALNLIDAGCHGTRCLLDRLRQRSGIDALVRQVDAHFAEGSDRLRASSALPALDWVAWSDGGIDSNGPLARMRRELTQIRREPSMRQVEVGAALNDLNAGRFSLSEQDQVALVLLATGRTPAERLALPASASAAEIAARAAEQNDRWRTLAAKPSQALAHCATVAREFCEAMYFHAEDGKV